MKGKSAIKIKCADDLDLGATLYEPNELKAAIMICPATGIRQRFYNSFATFLSENGYGVICFDNRGVGDSINGSINAVNASLVNWGRLDMTAVLEELKHRFPNTTYHLFGHSAGGQLVGLMDNALELSSIFNFAASSGKIKNMPYPFRILAIFFMNYFIPLSNLFFGKTYSHWVGMGEPLPKKVGEEWSRWCNGAGYCETDFGKSITHHLYDELEIPSIWYLATDDGIANIKNVEDMTRVFTKSKSTIEILDPQKLGVKEIGHMKFFSSKNKALWNRALVWLKNNN